MLVLARVELVSGDESWVGVVWVWRGRVEEYIVPSWIDPEGAILWDLHTRQLKPVWDPRTPQIHSEAEGA